MRKLFLVAIALLVVPSSFGAITHVSTGCSTSGSTSGQGSTWTFSCTPNAANDAILFFVSCGSAAVSSMTATGWTITALSPSTGSSTAGFGASFGAISPNTSSATFTVTGASGCGFVLWLVDEFSGTDTTGGTTTFYAHGQNTNTTGGCSGGAVTSSSANDAVWGACSDSLATTNWQGSGWTKGVTDTGGDGTEFKLATGSQTPAWASTSGSFVQVAATIKAAGGGGSPLTMPPVIY